MTEHLRHFARELESQTAHPERLALHIGGLVDGDLDVGHYLAALDDLANEAEDRLLPGLTGGDLAHALLHVLGEQMGFQGNLGNYYDPGNSFLHLVIEKRRGLPITLSLLYMAVARRMGIRLEGMGFPAHFMLRYQDDRGSWLLDPFHRSVVQESEASSYLTGIFRQPVHLHSAVAEYTVSPRLLLLRLLHNLRNVYLSNNIFHSALAVLDFMVLVEPDEPELWRDRGLLHIQNGKMLAAESDLRRYFSRRDRLHLFWQAPEAAIPGLPGLYWEGDPSTSSGDSRSPTSEEREVMAALGHIRAAIERAN
ncbi:MAG: tetratricopeptide repeat protein [Caldilineaceae bacterium]|nr:tetratricopeptide repeat protein [Caldilineaceae bacterium]